MSGFRPERGSEEWEREHQGVERGSEAWAELYGSVDADPRAWYVKKRFIVPAALIGLIVYRANSLPRGLSTSGAEWNTAVSSAGLETSDRAMSFDDCNRRIRSIADEIGIAPINIVESDAMRIVRFPTSDGSVLVTCNAIDEKMVVVKSTAD